MPTLQRSTTTSSQDKTTRALLEQSTYTSTSYKAVDPNTSTIQAFVYETRKDTARSDDSNGTDLQRVLSDPLRDASNGPPNHLFSQRYGRRFFRDPRMPYPLPVDLVELHRQSLHTLMLLRAYGAPFCSPFFDHVPPKKVLEIACGSALWSSTCHSYFQAQNYPKVSFTGLDLAPVAPDLAQQGVDWRFVQHDIRKRPLPFPDGEFDFIFAKDMALCHAHADHALNPLGDLLRYLQPGGVLEIWEGDYLFRTLLPHPSIPPGVSENETEQAETSATYLISSSTAFAEVQNRYLADYNSWIQQALDRRGLTTVPCSLANWAFASDHDLLENKGCRRIAIPFGEIRWEREGVGGKVGGQASGRNGESTVAEKQAKGEGRKLTANQLALRRTALTTVIGFIESMESLLKAESGKQQDEWDRWWSGMTHDLLEKNGTLNGECLEMGAWWGRKN